MSINPADPKWLEILKASGWQTGALALAFAAFIALVKAEIIPTTDSPLWIALPAIGGLVCGFLAFGAIADVLAQVFKPALRFSMWRLRRIELKQTQEYIPHMTDEDKQIIGYLLYHNQQTFQADDDGGYAGAHDCKRHYSKRCASRPSLQYSLDAV